MRPPERDDGLAVVTEAEVLEAARTQRCWCGNPKVFRNLAGHLWRAHGIRAWEVRDMLGLPQSLGFVSDETRSLMTAHGNAIYRAGVGLPQVTRRGAFRPTEARRRGAALSWVGVPEDERRERTRAARESLSPEDRARNAAKARAARSHESLSRAGRKGGKARAAQMTHEERVAMALLREARRRAAREGT